MWLLYNFCYLIKILVLFYLGKEKKKKPIRLAAMFSIETLTHAHKESINDCLSFFNSFILNEVKHLRLKCMFVVIYGIAFLLKKERKTLLMRNRLLNLI